MLTSIFRMQAKSTFLEEKVLTRPLNSLMFFVS